PMLQPVQTKICIFPAIFLLIMLYSLDSLGQIYNKENVSVLPFDGWQGYNADGFQEMLTGKITTRIINSQRFNVVDRANLKRTIEEQNLQLSGIIDDSTVVEVGKLAGVQKFIVGNFTGNTVEHYPPKYNDDGKVKEKAYYQATVSVTIRMLEVESSRYGESAEASASGRGENSEAAFTHALDSLAESVVAEFEQHFAIQTFIKDLERSTVTIPRGRDSGVKVGMNFVVHDLKHQSNLSPDKVEINSNTGDIGRLKIVSTESNTAQGRLFGDFSQVVVGNIIRETKDRVKIEASILDKFFGRVTVNAGADLGLTKGSTFNVMKQQKDIIDPKSGEVYATRFKPIGTVIITEVQPTFARGKIVKGRYFIREGMKLKETTPFGGWAGLSIGYGLFNIEGDVNRTESRFELDTWKGTVSPIVRNQYRETYGKEIATVDYTDKAELPQFSSVLQISTYFKSPVRKVSTGLDFKLYNFGEQDLGAVSVDLSLSQNIGILPEILYLTPGIGFGIGRSTQQIPTNIVKTLSQGKDDQLTAYSFFVLGKLSARLKLGKLVLWADADYHTLRFSQWEYRVGTGETDEEGEETTERRLIDRNLVPYPDVRIPATVSIGITGEFDFTLPGGPSSSFPGLVRR
ncbi:MAG: CsgG/HfaB family protein, partial [Candidatus Poribacteria bacterium]|nr:CsgG/HfaB family protein [Candidatus Poribacteria bacterium]